MRVVVQKYGGSSVATPEKIHAVADRVARTRQDGAALVVVVSAMGKTTDELLALARSVSGGEHRRELDLLLSAGERMSMALLAMALRDRGVDALSLTGSQAGIITTTDHNQARVIEVRPVRVQEALDRGCVVIVGGFAGVSTSKDVTTLGRGGSDTTAIALAAALQAEHCDIFSDVDGVYTADPRVVPDVSRLDALPHGAVLELGLRGARVLAPEAIDHARRHGVTLRARGTQSEGVGTVITDRLPPGRGRVLAVTLDRNALPVEATGAAAATLAETLDAAAIAWRDLQVEGDPARAWALVDLRNSPDAAATLSALPGLLVRADEGTVTAVGEGIFEQPALWRRAMAILAAEGVQPARVWSSPWGVTATAPRDRLEALARAWHAGLPMAR